MADTQNDHLSSINTPDDPHGLGNLFASVTWHLHEDLMGNDHFPIVIKTKFRRTLGYAVGARTAARPAFLTHWDKYRKLLEGTSPSGDIAHLTGQILYAKEQATRRIQVPYDHPDPDKCLLTLWNRRLRLLAQYHKSGHRRFIKRKLRITQQTIEDYTTALASERWMTLCEGFNGNTSTPRAWSVLRSLLGPTKTCNGVRRVALKEAITPQELAERAASEFFPHTSQPITTTYERDDPVEDFESYSQPFTLFELNHALNTTNTHSAPGADQITTTQLRNHPDTYKQALLEEINRIWEEGKLPPTWSFSLLKPISERGNRHITWPTFDLYH
ncbi:hypothetical protein HPB47_018134 [Ixodes persulcatus]|uniref:Uncharacterized protein n=1 Tax=Ixodes persulcatus TaxID=34615 RepID=A0AC60QLK2_IXOPE|nr:hypothetical protein HPB47_018134 [Ixodes persulcatus]